MSARDDLTTGDLYPYDLLEEEQRGWPHRAARGVIANLQDRSGVGDALADIDWDIRKELVRALEEVITLAFVDDVRMHCVPVIPSKPKTLVEIFEEEEDRMRGEGKV